MIGVKMFCSECGASLPEGASHCPTCGAAVVASTAKPSASASTGAAGVAGAASAASAAPRDPRQDDAQDTAAGQAGQQASQYQQAQAQQSQPYQQAQNQQYQQAQNQQPYQSYQQPQQQYAQATYAGDTGKSKVAAGLLAIFLGSLGIHKFYLGYNTEGLIMLLVSVCGAILSWLSLGITGIAPTVMAIIGLIEGIIYLSSTDAQFQHTYVDNKKTWF